jgi:hypothetical protein
MRLEIVACRDGLLNYVDTGGRAAEQGCQIFPGTRYQNGGKYIYLTTIKYTKCPLNIPNSRKIDQRDTYLIYQHLPLQEPPKFAQIGILGFKICHLATLLPSADGQAQKDGLD